MSELQRIDDQLYRMFEAHPWHGPSVIDALAGVDAQAAAARSIPDAHTIWELVAHMTVWLDVPRRRTEEMRAIEPTPEQDWPPVPPVGSIGDTTGEAAWREAQNRLRQAYQDLRELLARLDEGRLEETAPGRNYPVYVMLHGVIQHLAYHSGQIVLLKKAG